jgi:uncharacterized protein
MDNSSRRSGNAELQALSGQFLSSLRNADRDLLWTITYEKVEWSLPGHGIISGLAKGQEAVLTRMRHLRHFEVHFELLHVLYGMEGFALSLHNTARRRQEELSVFAAIICHVEMGKIYWIETMVQDVEAINRFFVVDACD